MVFFVKNAVLWWVWTLLVKLNPALLGTLLKIWGLFLKVSSTRKIYCSISSLVMKSTPGVNFINVLHVQNFGAKKLQKPNVTREICFCMKNSCVKRRWNWRHVERNKLFFVKPTNELSIIIVYLKQACQTQTTVRAAHWVLKLEKLTGGRNL